MFGQKDPVPVDCTNGQYIDILEKRRQRYVDEMTQRISKTKVPGPTQEMLDYFVHCPAFVFWEDGDPFVTDGRNMGSYGL